jgi:hypothetical protein
LHAYFLRGFLGYGERNDDAQTAPR